jgi:hypothetical protein
MPVAYPSRVLYVHRFVLRRPMAFRRPPGGPMPVVTDHHRYCSYIVLYYLRPMPVAPLPVPVVDIAPSPVLYVHRNVQRSPLASRRPPCGPMPVVPVLYVYRTVRISYCTYIVLYYARRWPLAADRRADASSTIPGTVRTYHHRKEPARRLAFNGTYTAGPLRPDSSEESVSETFSQYVGGRQPTD